MPTLSNAKAAAPRTSAQQVAALLFPLWEQATPQWSAQSPYQLISQGYKRNELIYACISKWANAIAEAPCKVYKEGQPHADRADDPPVEQAKHPLRQLIRRPNPRMSEKDFWRATQIYLKSSGFAAWEKERNRIGQVINLWPLRPDFCTFKRGPGDPLATIVYTPGGLSPMPIEKKNVLLFQYFDPVAPLLKALAPSEVAQRVTEVDNSATDFMKVFWQRGAVVNGLIKTQKTLTQAEADRIRARWRQQHGGFNNWTDPAVLGDGVEYQQTQMDFRQMQFVELDGRDEARICQTMKIPPILVGAKIGLDRATYSNYEQARRAWYEEDVAPEWDFLESGLETQMLGDFEAQPLGWLVDFDVKAVRAMQEDRTAKFARAVEAAKQNVITRDEARKEMDYDPIDNADVFVGITIRESPPTVTPGVTGVEETGPIPTGNNPALVGGQAPKQLPPPKQNGKPPLDNAAQQMERKQFKAYLRHGGDAREFAFKHLDEDEQRRLLFDDALRRFNEAQREPAGHA